LHLATATITGAFADSRARIAPDHLGTSSSESDHAAEQRLGSKLRALIDAGRKTLTRCASKDICDLYFTAQQTT